MKKTFQTPELELITMQQTAICVASIQILDESQLGTEDLIQL